MENPELNSEETEQVKHLVGLALAESTGTAKKATIHLGPFSAFILISCLQLAQRKQTENEMFQSVIAQLIAQFSVLFPEGGPSRAMIEMGNDPSRDVSDAEAGAAELEALAAELLTVPGIAELAENFDNLGQLGPYSPHGGVHIHKAPALTELEASLAVANICGWEPSRLIGFVVLAFDGSTTPYLLSNGSKEQVIDGLKGTLSALLGREEGQSVSHENDSGVMSGPLVYRDSQGETKPLKCPQCKGEEWLGGTLGDGEQVLVCGTCSATHTSDQVREMLDELGAQRNDEH